MAEKLNITKVLEFKRSWWKKLAQYIKKWIWDDMLQGKLQATRNKPYHPKYAKYKANEMRRFSDGKRLGSPRILKDGTTKNYKYNVLKGIHTNTSTTPNMLLTGETIKGLEYKNSNQRAMVMSYKDKDADKIIGNEVYGRDIRTLNDKNMNKLKKQFEIDIDQNLKQWASKKITITIGK